MKFNVPSKTLYNYASAVGKVINQKNALMILDNFLFSLQDNTLSITGQDVENALTATFEVLDAEARSANSASMPASWWTCSKSCLTSPSPWR